MKIEKKDLLRYLGNRVRLELDDHSVLCGRLVSVSASGNVVITDAERERTRKRRRSASREQHSTSAVSRECYASVVYLRGSCISAIFYTSGVTTDKGVISQITGGRREAHVSRTIELANASPAVRF